MIASISAPSQIPDTQMIQNPVAAGTTAENKFLSLWKELAKASQSKEDNKTGSDSGAEAKTDGRTRTNTAAKDKTRSLDTEQGSDAEVASWAGAEERDQTKQADYPEQTGQTAIDFNGFVPVAVICQGIPEQKTDLDSDHKNILSEINSIKEAVKSDPDSTADMLQALGQTEAQTVAGNVTGPLASGVSKKGLPKGSEQTEKVLFDEQVVSPITTDSSANGKILQNEEVSQNPFIKLGLVSPDNGKGMISEGNKLFEKTFTDILGEESLLQGQDQASVERQRALNETPQATLMADVLSASLKKTDQNKLKIVENSGKNIDLTTTSDTTSKGAAADDTNGLKVRAGASLDTNTSDSADTLSDKPASSAEPLAWEQSPAEKDSANSMPQELWGSIQSAAGSAVAEEKAPNIDQPQAYQQIYDRLSNVIKENGNADFKMKLYPEGLGEISVTVSCQENKLSLEIITDNPLTQHLIQGQADELKAALLSKNYEIPSLLVSAKSETASAFTAGGNTPFSFWERNAGDGQYRENQGYTNYDLSDYLSSEESFIEASPQNIYFGNFSSWA